MTWITRSMVLLLAVGFTPLVPVLNFRCMIFVIFQLHMTERCSGDSVRTSPQRDHSHYNAIYMYSSFLLHWVINFIFHPQLQSNPCTLRFMLLGECMGLNGIKQTNSINTRLHWMSISPTMVTRGHIVLLFVTDDICWFCCYCHALSFLVSPRLSKLHLCPWFPRASM